MCIVIYSDHRNFGKLKQTRKIMGPDPDSYRGRGRIIFIFTYELKETFYDQNLNWFLWLYLIDPDVWCSISFIGNEQEKRSIGTDMAWKKTSPLNPCRVGWFLRSMLICSLPHGLNCFTGAHVLLGSLCSLASIHQAFCFSHSHLAK